MDLPTSPPVRRNRLTHQTRTDSNDHRLAIVLTGVAGAANAGGFFALGQYTSHMTGYLAQLADNLALGNFGPVGISVLAVAAFVTGAAFCAILINHARDRHPHHQYSLPIAVQGGFLVCFAGGAVFTSAAGHLFSLACLCFIMGMQNATITKLSGARIRTTHVTGMVTDIGIEIGRSVYRFMRPRQGGIAPASGKLSLLVGQVLAFLAGGVIGAFGYAYVGFPFSLPLAAVLLAISLPPLLFDAPQPRAE